MKLTPRGWLVVGLFAWIAVFVILNLLMPWDAVWVKTK